MTRIPLLADSRVVVAEPGDDDVILRPPAPREALDDVQAAVREALRFPLGGPPLEELVTRGGTRDRRDRAAVAADPVGAARAEA